MGATRSEIRKNTAYEINEYATTGLRGSFFFNWDITGEKRKIAAMRAVVRQKIA